MRVGPLNLTWGWGRKSTGLTIEQVVANWHLVNQAAAGIAVTPENCMQSPTVNAIVTAISRRIASLPIKVFRTVRKDDRTRREELPNHPVAKLLAMPNEWQDPVQYWLDAASYLVRYGNFYSFLARGSTGPIRELVPLSPRAVQVTQEVDWSVVYRATLPGGQYMEIEPGRILHARGPARDGLVGNSTVIDIHEAIALDIQAEKMGAAVFGNGATPGMVFKFQDGFQGFETDEEGKQFLNDYQERYGKAGRFKAMLLPKGIEIDSSAPVENEKAQYIATRQYQRTVIAAAFGVPPHMVGDLSRGTFNNVEQQSLDFVMATVLPYVRIFEASMERALLTLDDRRGGIIIRFDLEGVLRADFKSRQEGLKIQREMGVINPNDWRERENMNPISDEDGGELYWQKGPSGQGEEPPAPATEGIREDDGAKEPADAQPDA